MKAPNIITSILLMLLLFTGYSDLNSVSADSLNKNENIATEISPRPKIAERGFIYTKIEENFPLERSELRTWLNDENKLLASIKGSERIARPVDTQMISGQWPEPGATRRVILEDGHSFLEHVIANTDDTFEYQIWNITNDIKLDVAYAHAVQSFTTLADGTTQMTWTYKLMPTKQAKRTRARRARVKRLLKNDIRPMLGNALASVKNRLGKDELNAMK